MNGDRVSRQAFGNECLAGNPSQITNMRCNMNDATKKIPFLRKTTEWDEGGRKGIVQFLLGNGQYVEVNEADISPENRYRLMIHGISQKLGDSCASFSKDLKYGEAYQELQELSDLLATPDWSRKREGAGRQAREDLIEALAKLKKQEVDVVRAAVEKADEATLKKWAKNSTVDAEIQAIRKRRADQAKKQSADTIDDIDLGI